MSVDIGSRRLARPALGVHEGAPAFRPMAHLPRQRPRSFARSAWLLLFLHICEGLPNRGTAMRRKYFTGSQNSLYEALGAMDLARAIGAVSQEDADAVQALGVRFAQLLSALLR